MPQAKSARSDGRYPIWTANLRFIVVAALTRRSKAPTSSDIVVCRLRYLALLCYICMARLESRVEARRSENRTGPFRSKSGEVVLEIPHAPEIGPPRCFTGAGSRALRVPVTEPPRAQSAKTLHGFRPAMSIQPRQTRRLRYSRQLQGQQLFRMSIAALMGLPPSR
jgi:hypothetical protein